mmetsp:Transcript_52361/g.83358  ORF Transcript_52361/g.83358 Transcript_52361/m.83358 type:complete len:136 (-) Transcript_52361:78-485(-)|eukprot:CAMPEP_0197030248 /NCGR_PEP_ID=MMETSP1384-20130603/9519_1 /TAXON_ID=29189 /ORGANISM="Ammonia sp." /LENGTH=135 /DNA_ID=CAMNT_0042459557 /DNA_START=84 /DNA_END=491 /DNA_ORIENTATION=+
MNCARKLKQSRKSNRKAAKSKGKKHAHSNKKQNGRNSHYRGTVIERYGLEAKQPNSGVRKCVRVQLIADGKKVNAFVPCDGGMNFIDENDEVLLQRHSKRIGDLSGIKYKVIDVCHKQLKPLIAGKYDRRPRTFN